MSDDPVNSCDVCGAPVQKIFSPVAVHFKGTGFYSTDYGSSKRARELKDAEGTGKKAKDKDAASSSSDSSSSDSSDSKKSDATPAKSESKASATD